MISLNYFVALAGVTFVCGLAGCLRRRGHVALIVVSGLITTLATVLLIVSAHAYSGEPQPPSWVFLLFLASAAQAGVAAALMICVYRRRGALALRRINAPRG